jgi:hypothetical protein
VPLRFLVKNLASGVLFSQHLGGLYGVSVSAINQAVKRNLEPFPEDFMFQLTEEEFDSLKSRIVISSWSGFRRGRPHAGLAAQP